MNIDAITIQTIADIKSALHELKIAYGAVSEKRAKLELEYKDQDVTSPNFDRDFWRYIGVHDALSKFLQFATADIAAADKMMLAQKARYFCDLMMWVKHLTDSKKDPREYFEHLLRGKRFHYESLIRHFEREIVSLRKIGRSYNLTLLKAAGTAALLKNPVPTHEQVARITDAFHNDLYKNFSIYRTPSYSNYDEYADAVENGILHGYKSTLEKLNEQINRFEQTLGRKIASKHDSTKFSKSVGMYEDYDFIYRLTSQHLHGTPVSMSTDMSEISDAERLIFLEYIKAKVRSILAESLYLFLNYRQAPKKIPGLGPNSFYSAFRRNNIQ